MGDVIDSTHMLINKGNPLFARKSKGNPPTALNFQHSILLKELLDPPGNILKPVLEE